VTIICFLLLDFPYFCMLELGFNTPTVCNFHAVACPVDSFPIRTLPYRY